MAESHLAYAPVCDLPAVRHSGSNLRLQFLKLAQTKIGRKLIIILIPLAILSAIIGVVMELLPGQATLGHPSSGADNISPYTTLLFPVSGLSCKSYTMTRYYGSPTGILTSMYILNKTPDLELSSIYNFSIHRSNKNMVKLKAGEFYQWSFWLHTNSTIEVNSCVWEGDTVELIVIQGETKFREWVDTSKQADVAKIISLKPCSTIRDKQFLMANFYKVPMNDKYYFVYSSPQINRLDSLVHINMSFTKLEYSLNESGIHCNCSLDIEHIYTEYYTYDCCRLPILFNGFVFVRTTPHNENSVIDWENKVYITWSCDESYVAYLVLFFCPLLVLIIVVLFFVDVPIAKVFCRCSKCGTNVEQTDNNRQPISQCCYRVFIAFLLLSCVLFVFMGSLSIILAVMTFLFLIISFISGGHSNNDFQLSIQASNVILLALSIYCNKCIDWVEKKVTQIGDIIPTKRVSQRNSNANTAPTRNLSLSVTTKTKVKIFRLVYLFFFIPSLIATIVDSSVFLTFLEGFYPVLHTYFDSSAHPDLFTPGDSHAFSFESFFCSGYSITSYGSPHLTANLYLLNASSLVEKRDISHIYSNEYINANLGVTWNFYLNRESSASINACIYNQEQYALLEIFPYNDNGFTSGKKSYDVYNCTDWISVKGNSPGRTEKYLITIYTDIADWVNVHVEILLNRSEYSLESINTTAHHMCSISSHTQDTCTVSSSLIAGRMTGLIVVKSDQSSVNWHETISITNACTYHWSTWTALWLPVLIINAICCTCVCGMSNMDKYDKSMERFRDGVKKVEVRQQNRRATDTDRENEPLLVNDDTSNRSNINNYGSTRSDLDPVTALPSTANTGTHPAENIPTTDPDFTSYGHTLTVAVDIESSSESRSRSQ